jgi:formate hydrogenlyase subunit 6/NADH:ubiquinone oxidoreductase subunit I
MGYPFSPALIDLLRETFSPVEARVALAIPNHLAPLEVANLATIAPRTDLPEAKVSETLESLSKRNLIYTAKTKDGVKGYALLQVGFGMPQTFFWDGKQDDRAKRMTRLIRNYFTVPITQESYGAAPTKCFKYSPANLTVNVPMQGVMPNEQMGPILDSVSKIALAHCPCRMVAKISGRTDCQHTIEVCFKYDELAEFVIHKGLAREVSRDEALHILQECEKEGLVHMVDNAQGQIKHTCNCCGHYCWNVGIIRRRKIPRDILMDVYFVRETDREACIGCGVCSDICPVGAVEMVDDKAEVDTDWCIGCGVCAVPCPTGAISIKRRTEESPPKDFSDLHHRIRVERGLG